MLCCPARSLTSASRRLPGGDFRSSSTVAASSIVIFRVATLRIAPKRCDFSFLNSSSVSLHLKPWIAIHHHIPFPGKRQDLHNLPCGGNRSESTESRDLASLVVAGRRI